jgi:hypothetical protein
MPSAKRPWFRFSLRAFLVLFTILCVFGGLYASKAVQQRQAIAELGRLGGWCHYDDWQYYQLKPTVVRNGRLVWLKRPEKPWLRTWLGDDWFANVTMVTMRGRDVTNADLHEAVPSLAKLPRLKRLELRTTSITDAGLKPLQSLNQLEYLSLYETRIKIDEPGLLELRKALPELRVGY